MITKMKQEQFFGRIRRHSILYVEDDAALQATIGEFLARLTPHLFKASSAEEAKVIYHEQKPGIILLDINLPGISGIDFCESIRGKDAKTRFIMTTAYTDKPFLLKAVELGLTRYLVKPMTSDELIDALHKAVEELEKIDPTLGRVDLGRGIHYDGSTKTLIVDGKNVPLRRKEVELLEFFLSHPRETIPYEQFEHGVWQDSVMTADAIRSQIRNLRKKCYPELIKNVSGIGYRFTGGGDGIA
jgi:two-component system response regulator VanR